MRCLALLASCALLAGWKIDIEQGRHNYDHHPQGDCLLAVASWDHLSFEDDIGPEAQPRLR
jgi:hypothetical protein